ncbi:MAG: sulfite exporter TauE/SafE family protein [Methylococcales bacterium]|nr:sulfite exporter TauE/SafE family protein [Methylococcales bacterium]
MAILIALATVIGILLGLLGGGGSILTVPVLVYLTDLSTKSAIITSLIVVCLTSSIAVINYARAKKVCWKTGSTFGAAGMIGAFIGGRISAYVPDPILLVLFAMVMVIASIAMFKDKKADNDATPCLELNFCPMNLPVSAILFDGLLVGLVTGLVGVGGGFLLVPALTLLAGLPIQSAIGTSLFIIVLQSAAALAGHANHMAIDIELTSLVTGCAIVGSFIGSNLSGKINAVYLKKGFGGFVFCLGSFLLYREMTPALISQIEQLIIEHQNFLTGALTIATTLMLYRLWTWLHSLSPKT